MTRSLARSLTLVLTIFAGLSIFVVTADAAYQPDRPISGIFGRTALTPGGSVDSLDSVNLQTGKSKTFKTVGYVDSWNALLENGVLVATTWDPRLSDPQPTNNNKLFTSGPRGLKTLVTWSASGELCRDTWRPLAVDGQGRVTAMLVALKRTATYGKCLINRNRTRLFRIDADGSRKSLYLPNKFKAWLPTNTWTPQTFVLNRGRLAMFTNRPKSRVAVLNLRTRSAKQFAPGSTITGIAFASATSLLVSRDTSTKTVAKRFTTSGRAQRTIYAGSPATISACGSRTAIATRTLFSIRNRNGKQVYRHAPASSFEHEPSVTCSGNFLFFLFADEGCSHCGPMPPSESKLLELGKL